jgi:polycomb protein EED
MICFRAWPLHLRVISIGTVLEKQFEKRNIQLEKQRQSDIKYRQSNRQTDKQTERQTDREKKRQTERQTDWVVPRAVVEAWENIKSPELTEN